MLVGITGFFSKHYLHSWVVFSFGFPASGFLLDRKSEEDAFSLDPAGLVFLELKFPEESDSSHQIVIKISNEQKVDPNLAEMRARHNPPSKGGRIEIGPVAVGEEWIGTNPE